MKNEYSYEIDTLGSAAFVFKYSFQGSLYQNRYGETDDNIRIDNAGLYIRIDDGAEHLLATYDDVDDIVADIKFILSKDLSNDFYSSYEGNRIMFAEDVGFGDE